MSVIAVTEHARLLNKMLGESEDTIARLTTRVAELEGENAQLASWQCEFTDGKTGLVASEGGSTYCAMAKRVETLIACVKELEGALRWYGEQARLARLIHSGGDAGRHALADDGGKRARAVLSAQPAPMKLHIDDETFLAAVDRDGDHEVGAGSLPQSPPQKDGE